MKNRKFSKLVALLLALGMTTVAFASCNDTEDPNGDSSEETTPAAVEKEEEEKNDAPAEEQYTAGMEGVIDLSEYMIIRPETLDSADTKAVATFRTYVNEYCGTELVAKKDTDVADTDGKEILIGLTNRQASIEAEKTLKTRDWSISVKGNKIVILAGSESSLVNATNWIIENAIQKGNKFAKIGEGTTFTYDYVASEIKMGGKAVNSITVGYLNKDNVGFVDAGLLLADNIKNASGVKTSVGPYGGAEGAKILIGSALVGADYLKGVTVGPMQYAILKDGDNIVIIANDEMGAELGAQQIVKAILAGNKGPVDLSALCKDQAVTYKYGTDKLDLTIGSEYRIMSYNILRAELGGNTRYDNALNTILYYSPDVVGFQEYCHEFTKNLTPKLQANGYTVLGNEMVTDATTAPQIKDQYPVTQNNTPIAFKTDKFEVVDKGWQRLIPTDYVPSDAKEGAKPYGWTGYTVTWVVLKDKTTGDTFAVTATHNLANSGDVAVARRTEAIKEIINIVKQGIVAKYNCPTFCVGDYNTQETKADYKTFTSYKDGLTFSDARYIAERGYAAKATMHDVGKLTVSGSEASAIDHIFVTGNARVIRHRMATSTEAAKSSDHFPVMVDVVIG